MAETVKENRVVETKVCENESGEEPDHDPHYDPIISLPEVEVPTLEEDETVMLSLRAKLYRYDSNETPPEWKERGTGTVKILHHKLNDTVRVVTTYGTLLKLKTVKNICPTLFLMYTPYHKKLHHLLKQSSAILLVMRRDKTLKLCANHFITPFMNLKPSVSCERAWVYSVKDFSDETVKSELLAIKFANVDNALKWKEVFEDAKKTMGKHENKRDGNAEDKIISTDSPKLSDTFEEETKNVASDKEKENEVNTPNKESITDVTEKLSSMSIKETGAR